MKLTQQEKILALLRHAGPLGVNSYDLTYVHRIKQAPARIWGLKEKGYSIAKKDLRNGSTQYYLIPSQQAAANASPAIIRPSPATPRKIVDYRYEGNTAIAVDEGERPAAEQGVLL